MNVFGVLYKPEYIFRPLQIIRRLGRSANSAPEIADVKLPWGLRIRIRPKETIGSCIWRMGLYDLCVSETLWRLLDKGETALDVGANIGHMTSVMGLAVGPSGRVVSFEPHPEIFSELKNNVSLWALTPTFAPIELVNAAVSRGNGVALLHMPPIFGANRGTASLETISEGSENECEVRLVNLDEMLPRQSIGVMKIDVEGHELGVLEGARQLLEDGAIRDIIFEEHDVPPTSVTKYLERCGYKIFRLGTGVLGPKMIPISSEYVSRNEAPNFLATINSKRASSRLASRGWRVLGRQVVSHF